MENLKEASRVAREVALAEFDRFLEAMDIDADTTAMDAEDLKSFEEARRKLVRAMETGHLVIDDKGQPVFTPHSGVTDPITFYEPTGATWMAVDSKKKGQDVAKMVALMAEMTRQPAQRFSKMAGRDYKVCTTITSLFLA